MVPRILFAWELGANFGHATKITQVAAALRGRADVWVAARDPQAIRAMAPGADIHLLPAPYGPTRRLTKGEAGGANYSGLLLTEGWDAPEGLAARVEAWRGLVDLLRPAAIVAQAAPTAMLAGLGQGIPRVVLGSGYDNPPVADPMPAFDRGTPEAERLAAAQHAQVLEVVNAARARLGEPALPRLSEVFRPDLSLLMTWELADHYAPRGEIEAEPARYLGALATTGTGQAAAWRGNGRPRIFAYLRPGSPSAGAGFGALDHLGPESDIILSAPGIPPGDAKRLRARSVQVFDAPVRLDPLLESCDLGVSHGSNGLSSLMLSHGIPQVGLPGHVEQMLFTRTLARSRLGLGLGGRYGAEEVVALIRRCLGDEAMRQRVAEAAQGLRDPGALDPAETAAESLLALL
ncbi:glycosyltransferase [Poseidonocella sedimentorum]|uniref:UDP:flavonoid glycosyltransferase YjiC, YdhE family n=1 Tax=Poseidonocella sedimentorum TaxID=871652 RepID=A0A1I6DXZ3_9RHOB|nr:hypothetical protein [Poseidonocella sedimentorum]SFR10201.1 UDP:flavonoid glycosyltransferase YjiC, YdhE family [Poseidonocella sedimentorum]